MSNHYTSTSFAIPVNDDQAEKAKKAYEKFQADQEDSDAGEASFEMEHEDDRLWFSGNNVDVGQLQGFLLDLGTEIGLTGAVGVEWAQHCDKLAPESFGGGAFMIDFDRGEIVAEQTTSRTIANAERAQEMAGEEPDLKRRIALHAAVAANNAMLDFFDHAPDTVEQETIRTVADMLAALYVPHAATDGTKDGEAT